MGELLVKDKDIVIPGQELALGMDFLPASGTCRDNDKIIASQLGLISLNGRLIKIIPLNGKYVPKKGDNVIVVTGKDRGKKGKVLRAFPKKNMVVVENVNVKKHHQKPRKSGEKGQIIEMSAPVHVSNVMIVDPKTGTATRVGMKVEKGEKVRVAKKSGAII